MLPHLHHNNQWIELQVNPLWYENMRGGAYSSLCSVAVRHFLVMSWNSRAVHECSDDAKNTYHQPPSDNLLLSPHCLWKHTTSFSQLHFPMQNKPHVRLCVCLLTRPTQKVGQTAKKNPTTSGIRNETKLLRVSETGLWIWSNKCYIVKGWVRSSGTHLISVFQPLEWWLLRKICKFVTTFYHWKFLVRVPLLPSLYCICCTTH